jgi:hypothetical protein
MLSLDSRAVRFSCKLIVAALTLFYVLPDTLCAQQPFATDDADTTERGKFHLEFLNAFDVLQQPDYPARMQNTGNLTVNFGLTDRIELGVAVPLITIFNANVSPLGNPTGFGDFNFDVKYNFYREKHGSWLPALTVTTYVEMPTGNVEKQLGSGFIDVYLYGVAQKTLSKDFTLRANSGIVHSRSNATGLVGVTTLRRTVFTASASLIKDFNSRLSFGAEMFGAWTDRRFTKRISVDASSRW